MNKTFPDSESHHINFGAENKYLKITIAVLREKLEELQRHRSEIIQQTRVSSQDEIIQLQSIVNTLRSQLEKTQINQDEQIQLAIASENDQNNQLKETINSLRQKLDKNEIISYENLDDLANKISFYKKNDHERKKIAKNGKDKYFKIFNETKISKYIIDKSLGRNVNLY